MELHQLRYFCAVVREGTFTRAAKRLYITQPSLSEQIRKLESELGSPLFERLGRSLVLTAAGEAFRPHAERVLLEVEQARLRILEVRGLRRGRLAVGSVASAAARLLPAPLAEFRQHHPGVETILREHHTTDELEDAVLAGELDLAVVQLPGRRSDLEVRHLLRESLVVVVPAADRLAGRRSVALLELAEDPFVAMSAGSDLRMLLEACCHRAGFQPRVVIEARALGSLLGLVLAGAGL
ncbi:MAG TPA: LysR substrate-binding domain-containing protein, partial [Candidatus Dormibacteraeota bacterium]|nr:LysR substrate-binding domain-containing protein [Candidatus Dormibacteraeota bacterium]